MADWFKNHPATSIIGHTILIGSAVFAFSKFVLIENTEHLYKAQLAAKDASIAQYEARIDFLENENNKLEDEVIQYLDWLQKTPGTIQHVEEQNSELKEQLAKEKEKNNISNSTENTTKYYKEYNNVSDSEAIIDEKTGIVFSVNSIGVTNKGDLSFSIPNLEQENIEDVSAGYTKKFTIGEETYQFIIMTINYVYDTYSVILKEI